MRTADEIIMDIGEMNQDSMDDLKFRDKSSISINEAEKMIIIAKAEAIKECAEKATVIKSSDSGFSFQNTVDKESILSLLKENK